MMNDEITQLVNGIDLTKSMENVGLNQMRNIANALDNVLMQIEGTNSPFYMKIAEMRKFYFQSMIEAKNILEY